MLFPSFCLLLGTLYPAYASFKAIESTEAEDDKQWLTYWVVFCAIMLTETALPFVTWIWGYYMVKAAVLLWLIAPQTHGAMKLYDDIIKPLLTKHAAVLDPVFGAGTMALKFPITGQLAKVLEAQGPGAAKSLAGVVFNSPVGAQLAKLAQQSPELLESVLRQAVNAAGQGGANSGHAR